MANTFLSGLELAAFRGIGESPQTIWPFSDLNFFIGPNNAGKSTVLAFMHKYLREADSARLKWARQFDPLDRNITKNNKAVHWAVCVPEESSNLDLRDFPYEQALAARLLGAIAEDGHVWLQPTSDGSALEFAHIQPSKIASTLPQHDWRRVWSRLTGQNGGSLEAHWVPETLNRVARSYQPSFPEVSFIPAIRQVGPAGAAFEDFSGAGLIDKLAELQNPPHDRRDNKEKFEAINGFLRAATESDGAEIEVPHDRRHLMVHMDGRVLPLSSLGTGIHEVIMIAAFCTLVEEQIVCIEEPEIHLHPLLQRKLMQYLRDNTSNQYFIATHSASLIDSVDATVFGVEKDPQSDTTIRLAAGAHEKHRICHQLGYRASDLLQSNAVIWVEGPSDRIYLNHWIRSVDPLLKEGVDYSIMFYGGRLLSHLSADDPDVHEFISLRRLNRNILVVIDSDKSSAHSRINATKRRIVGEFGASHSWVTAGREIENYIPPSIIAEAVKNLYNARFGRLADNGRYAQRLRWVSTSGNIESGVDKIKVAKFVAQCPADLSCFDLRKRVSAVIDFIRSASLSR